MTHISDRIKSLRKSEQLTQKEFAKRLLISQSYLSGLETGNETPTNKLIKLICLEFGVNENWLIDGLGDMYDTVYENDKALLVTVSNSALLKIMTLLTTNSNVEYGFYAYSIEAVADILKLGDLFNNTIKINFLEIVQLLFMDIERVIHLASYNDTSFAFEQHKKGILDDINQLFKYIEANQKADNNQDDCQKA